MMTSIDGLNQRYGRAGHVGFHLSPLGGPVAEISALGARVTVALRGGHVLGWMAGGRERLWLSPVSRLDTARPIRGGVPVCWPWFADHSHDPAKPSHGFVRTKLWDVAETSVTDGRASLTVTYTTDEVDLAIWPHEADVRLTVAIERANELSLALETENFGLAPLALGQALHTYFAVDDIARVRVEGLDGLTYIDKLDHEARKRTEDSVVFDREVDRIYLGVREPVAIVDEGAGSRINIRSEGSHSAVLWNPWIEKTVRLGDMGAADAYRRMLCFETANAADDMVLLRPGDRHRMTTRYRIG